RPRAAGGRARCLRFAVAPDHQGDGRARRRMAAVARHRGAAVVDVLSCGEEPRGAADGDTRAGGQDSEASWSETSDTKEARQEWQLSSTVQSLTDQDCLRRAASRASWSCSCTATVPTATT